MRRFLGVGLALAVLGLVIPVQPLRAQGKGVRATQLKGALLERGARHFFGLEPIQPGGTVALSLVYDMTAQAEAERANFVVLNEAGVLQFLGGADPLEVGVGLGSPLLFDPIGNRRTALVPAASPGGYTVIVLSGSDQPVTYTLEVQGGLLRDDAGQSTATVMVDSGVRVAPPPAATIIGQTIAPVMDARGPRLDSQATAIAYAPVQARRVTGTLGAEADRHTLQLSPETAADEVTLTLQYVAHEPVQPAGELNFWVLTQDGVRHLAQGGRVEELNLASGAPVLSLAGATVLRTQLRVASGVAYRVVVTNELGRPANYTLAVEGALLVDEQGQTYEAHAAALEAQALVRR